jgi:hypothetical protein
MSTHPDIYSCFQEIFTPRDAAQQTRTIRQHHSSRSLREKTDDWLRSGGSERERERERKREKERKRERRVSIVSDGSESILNAFNQLTTASKVYSN